MLSKKIILGASAVLLISLTSGYAFAEESATSSGDADTRKKNEKSISKDKDNLRPLLKNEKPLQLMKVIPLDDKLDIKQQTLRSRLSVVKDETKKTVLLNIDSKISSVSARSIANMTNAVNRMTTILNSSKEKAAALKSQGANTAALDNAITEAERALASASAAVTALSNKDYSIPVTTEAAVKTNAGQVISQFRTDINAAHQAVMQAKQALVKVMVELKKVWREIKPTSTVTGTPTTTATPTVQVTPTNTVTPTVNQ